MRLKAQYDTKATSAQGQGRRGSAFAGPSGMGWDPKEGRDLDEYTTDTRGRALANVAMFTAQREKIKTHYNTTEAQARRAAGEDPYEGDENQQIPFELVQRRTVVTVSGLPGSARS